MKRWLILALLMCPVWAQSNGLRPFLPQSAPPSAGTIGSGTTITFGNNIAIGDLIVCATNWGNNTITTVTISDSLANTWTKTALFSENPSDNLMMAMWTISTSAGADTITISGFTGTNQNTNCASWRNPVGTFAFDTTATAGSGTAPTSQTINLTTATNGELFIVDTAASIPNFQFFGSFPHIFAAGQSGGAVGSGANEIDFVNTGLAGAQSFTQNANATTIGGSAHWGMIGLAFKVSTIAVTTDKLPHCAQGIACQFTLTAVGGTGAYTYAATGLPANGLSLNTATGVISGTPASVTGCNTIGVTVTDGTLTSATQNLSLCVGSTFASPAVIQSVIGTSPGSVTLPSVSSNNAILVLGYGPQASGADNWIDSTPTTDSFGDTFIRIPPLTTVVGTGNGAPTATWIACSSSSGNNTITNALGYAMAASEVSNVQTILDDATNGNFAGMPGSTFTNTTQNYTAQVPNEMLFTMLTIGKDIGCCTVSVDAPFTQLYSGGLGGFLVIGAAGYRNVTTATTYTSSADIISNSTLFGQSIAQQLIGLRPKISGLSCSGVPSPGLSTIRHKSQLY